MARPRERPEPVFVIDEDTGRAALEGIHAAGGQAVLLTDHFGRGALDVDWLPHVHKFGNAVITRDVAMRTNVDENVLLASCGVHVFMLRGQLKFDGIRQLVIDNISAMRKAVWTRGLPFIARVSQQGVVAAPGSAPRPGSVRKD